MKKISDINAFLKTVNLYGRSISNDYMLPGSAEKLIANGKLFIEARENAVFIFEEREGCLKLTFRVKDEKDANCFGDEFSTLIQKSEGNQNSSETGNSRDFIPNNGTILSSYTVNKGAPGQADAWLLANGFALEQERVRYTANWLNIDSSLLAEAHFIVDASVAYPIYRQCFDMRIADLPCPELFEGALCVRSASGEPAGVLSLGADRHIAVLPKYRGQGVAMRLYAMLAAYSPGQRTERLFADADNPASNALYRKLGFKQDGVVLRCYVYNELSK